MRRSFLLAPLVLLLVVWLVTRPKNEPLEPLSASRATGPVASADRAELAVEERAVLAEDRRVAVSGAGDSPRAASAPDAVRLRLARHSSSRGAAPHLGRVVAWATGNDRRGVEVVVTGVNADGWTEVVVPAPAGGVERVHAVWDEPGWTSSVGTVSVGSDELHYLQLVPQAGACVVGELVDARGRVERSGEVSLVPRGGGDPWGRSTEHVPDGRFRLNFTARGTYDLYARGSGGQARQVLELDPEQPPTALVVVLQGAGRLRGRILDVRGEVVASWPLVAATEGELFERQRAPIQRPSVEEDDDAAPGRPWTDTVSALDGTFELSGLRAGAFGIASGPNARAARGVVLATGLVPSVDRLELRVPVAWMTIEVTDERGRRLRFDPHERPGQPVKTGVPETDVYVVLEQVEGSSSTELSPRAWQGSGTWEAPRWSALVDAGVALRATVWACDRPLAVTELAAAPTPPESWTLRAAPATETAWLRIRPVGITATERAQLGFVVFDLASGVQVDRDVFGDEESVEVGIPPGRYEVRIRPIADRRYGYVPSPEPWSEEVVLAEGEERTLAAALVRRGRLSLGRPIDNAFDGPMGALEVTVTPSPGVSAESQTVTLTHDASLDLVPGSWTLTASGEDGRSATAVVEIEAGETATHVLEVSLPR